MTTETQTIPTLDIELDPLEKNREGALRLRKAPVWRYGFLSAVILLWALCLPTIFEFATSPVVGLMTAVGVLFAIALVVWYFLSNRVSGLHAAGTIQIVRSSGTVFEYRLEDGRLHKTVSGTGQSWPLSGFQRAELGLGEALLVFNTTVCFLPFRGASRQAVLEFVEAVEQSAKA